MRILLPFLSVVCNTSSFFADMYVCRMLDYALFDINLIRVTWRRALFRSEKA